MTSLLDGPTTAATPPDARSASPAKRRSPVTWVRRGGLTTLLFFLPLLFSFGFFAWFPIVRGIVMSVQQTNFVTDPAFVGLDNFAAVLADPVFPTAVGNTVLFTVLALLFGFPVPLLLSVVVAEFRRMRGFASVLAYLPVIIPPVAAVLLWKTFYDPRPDGLFNTVLGWFGAGPLAWLNDGGLALPAIVLQATWAGAGTATIIYIASLMTIRTELYEAAEIDGATVLRRFWHVTLPQLRNVIFVMLLLQLIGTFQIFTEPYIMTGGGPDNRTTSILLLIYRYAFLNGDYGKATALSLMLAIFLALLSIVYFRLTRRWSAS
ncbi:sugar ABC transporter permease [Herbiconiux sp. VKM Ac-1786]|uniref:carbohydrate ABC transporter permease n=1 Tax=Herbiconiux sp. VKM Ac-1786 TaxID=2783824 RepID=UPI00188C78D8|nr:sugar ABC transporter permease [Herbiconiux sp. VKM Ac-1786]MBF4571548.1 sugar ABC transporter permease [Herbiconiux sp. VKM Ac-1786]